MMPDLSSILVVLNFGCAMMCVLVAVMGAAWLASYMAPFNPSEAESSVRHETYMGTQYRLACVRERRRAMLSHIEGLVIHGAGHDATRPVTIPSIPRSDLPTRKIRTSPVVPAMCVKVGEVSPEPTPSHTPHMVVVKPTISDDVIRALTLAHLRARSA